MRDIREVREIDTMSESRGEGDMQGVDRLGDASAPQILEYGV